ncbi:hypothetical protein SMACR_09520 [Sordaria macrospora]|uniref:WGS project CABT00000000 data, contig 2.54 n=2 Tax=Sordaria macrospora TaxID=5147 RepID=F7W9P5_SORMK|nr:uncharacterized protein SMAC_09520 [Sordaria macrospora k-hell]KAA8632191.1 hypothetical protein SMACR_09520 [Sordaria macrospora]WPJ57143.1 hypothetical protein SMAC4_09520 [Sordaria macrospora]CCC14036.1 unnamed protein product [Sordaria macrospora k-hell]
MQDDNNPYAHSPHNEMSCSSPFLPTIPYVKNRMSTLSAIASVGLAPLKALVAAPFPMQQTMMIWKACTATDPIQEDEDDCAAKVSIHGNILTPVMVVATIAPTEATTPEIPAPTQLTMTPITTTADLEPSITQVKVPEDQVINYTVTNYTITAAETVVEYEPIDEPKNKGTHVRTDSASSTSSTTSNVSTQTTDSNWSNSTSSTAATDVFHTQQTEDCLKQKDFQHPVNMDNDIHIFTVAVKARTATVNQHEQPLGHKEESVFDLMAKYGVNEDQIADAEWKDIMTYEADRQRKEKRGPKVHCQEVFIGLPPTSPSNWQPGSDLPHEALEGMDNHLESSIHLNTLPPFDNEIETALQPTHGHQECVVEEATGSVVGEAIPNIGITRAATPKKFKIRSVQQIASSSPGAPVRKFRVGGQRLRDSNVSQSSTVQYKPLEIPRILVTEPIDPPTDLNNYPETDHHQATTSSFLEIPSQNDFDAFTLNLHEPLVSELDFERANFAPSSPGGKEKWLNKWAEKGSATRRRATMWIIDLPTAKEAMRVEDNQVFLPPVTTETPRVRRLNNYGEDYFLMTPESTASSELAKWSEETSEIFEDLVEQDKEEVNQQNKNSIAPEPESSSSRYDITYHLDELYDWENEGETVKKGPEHEVHRNEATKNKVSNLETDKPTATGKASAVENHDQTALVSALCHKWGPDRFDRWCEEYATPISEVIWNEAGTDLEEFTGANSEPAQEHEETVQTPRRHSFPVDNPPGKYLRTRRSLEYKEDVQTRLRLTRWRLERWTEGRDNMRYDEDFVINFEGHE